MSPERDPAADRAADASADHAARRRDSIPPSSLVPEPEAMRRAARLVADSVVDRWARLRYSAVTRLAGREEMEARLREPLPREGTPLEALVERFWRDIEPFAGKIDHPRFYAFVPSSPTFAALLGEWLAAGCNFFQGTWIESAGPSQVELVVLDWLKECLGFPPAAGGLLTSGGSAANLMGLAVAREERLEGPLERGRAYCSDQTHTAVERALRVLGLRDGALVRLPTDGSRRLDPEAVRARVRRDRERGRAPFCVVANAGTTNTGAVDPLEPLAELCAEEGLWLHVDGAYGAFARLADRGRRRLEGLERADSLVLDPHKWLYVGYEAGCLLVRDPGALPRAFRVVPDYLQDTSPAAGEVNFADHGIQLTRAFRALKLWFSMKAHGIDALAAAVDRTLDLAEHAEAEVRRRPALELVSPAALGVVAFRWRGDPPLPEGTLDARNRAIVEGIQAGGRFMISSTRLRIGPTPPAAAGDAGVGPAGGGDARYVIRLCPLNYRTTAEDVQAVLDEVVEAGARAAESGGRSGPAR